MPRELEWGLYENAIDSIRHAIEHYAGDEVEIRRYKYTILHLSQGVMLLLKERLRREHPNFIFTNVADATKTVDLDLLLSRLKKVAKVVLTDASEKVIRELADLRNKTEHFDVAISKHQADSVICRVIPFLVAFTRDELKGWFETEVGQVTWKTLLATQEYRANAIKNAQEELGRAGQRSFYCASCNANTGVLTRRFPAQRDEWTLDDNYARCVVCDETICGVMSCRECGKEIIFTGLPQNACYCRKCDELLQQDFPGFHGSTLWLIGEVRRWFATNQQLSGAQLFKLLNNVRGAGSGKPGHAYELLERGVIDFEYAPTRAAYDAVKPIAPFRAEIQKFDALIWTYPAK